MPTWKPGDRVKIKERKASQEEIEGGFYVPHFANLTGTVEAVYGKDEVAVRIDPESFTTLLSDVYKEATRRMRAKFLGHLSEEQRKRLTAEEKNFLTNFIILVKSGDLVKGPSKPPKAKAKLLEDEDLDNYVGISVVEGAVYDDPSIEETESPRRPSLQDLEAAEEEELRRRRN
ncbi:MAG: hypothetical protein QXI19_02795 [Candidatus Caldarchaeum sp.]